MGYPNRPLAMEETTYYDAFINYNYTFSGKALARLSDSNEGTAMRLLNGKGMVRRRKTPMVASL